MELELICIGIGNELWFKLTRGHTPKLCLINLIPWLVVGQPGELGRAVPLGQAVCPVRVSVLGTALLCAEEVAVPWGVGAGRVSQGCFQGESICFCPVPKFQLWLSAPEHSKGGGGF